MIYIYLTVKENKKKILHTWYDILMRDNSSCCILHFIELKITNSRIFPLMKKSS